MRNLPDNVEIHWTSLLVPSNPEELTAEEKDSVSRFVTPELRRRALVSRVFLKRILARKLGVDSLDLRFSFGKFGKPYLANADFHFNLSHSGEMAVCAVSSNPVGIDVEETREDLDYADISNHHFLPSERRKLDRDRFYRIWTAKEAFLKGLGEGLSTDLLSVEIVLGEGDALSLASRTPNGEGWELFGISQPGYRGTVALRRNSMPSA